MAKPANGVAVKAALVTPGQSEATLLLSVTKEAKVRLLQNLIVSGVMKQGKETITRYARAVAIRVVAAEGAAVAAR